MADGGDCLFVDSSIRFPMCTSNCSNILIGDGKCDGVLNVPAYKYDLGDCCKPLKDAICEFEDDYFCHMFTDFHGSILNFKNVCFFTM